MRPTAVLLLALAVLLAACSGTTPSGGAAGATSAVGAGDRSPATAEDVDTAPVAPTVDEQAAPAEGGDGDDAAAPATDAGSATEDGATAEQPAPATDAAERPTVEALRWTAPTLDGGTFAAADVAGEQVVLWMWAPWCSVCNAEAPDVARVLADLPDDVTFIGVAGRDELAPMQAFVAEHGLGDVVHVVDVDGALWASYGVSYQPAWVFITPEGETSVAAGALGYDGVFAAFDQVFGTA